MQYMKKKTDKMIVKDPVKKKRVVHVWVLKGMIQKLDVGGPTVVWMPKN